MPRIAYVSLEPALVFVTFPTTVDPPPVWGGVDVQSGNIMFHSRGERLHQRMRGPCLWSLIALRPRDLQDYGGALSGKPLPVPSTGRVLRPPPRDASRLQRLHAQACRLAETRPKILAHPEVARAIEQDLIQALITCLTAAEALDGGAAKRHHAHIMLRFEEAMAENPSRPRRVAENLRVDRREGANLAVVLRQVSRDQPPPVSAAAAIEAGAPRTAGCRPYDHRCRSCTAARLYRARALCRGVPARVWRDAFDHSRTCARFGISPPNFFGFCIAGGETLDLGSLGRGKRHPVDRNPIGDSVMLLTLAAAARAVSLTAPMLGGCVSILAVSLTGCGLPVGRDVLAYDACVARHPQELTVCEGPRRAYELDPIAFQATADARSSPAGNGYAESATVARPAPAPELLVPNRVASGRPAGRSD